jgi:hypothetical protein
MRLDGRPDLVENFSKITHLRDARSDIPCNPPLKQLRRL